MKAKRRSYERIITLMTDFGSKDQYVASMKGVILSIAPEVTIVDITHEIEPFNVLQAAFLLYQVARWFPAKTIHVVVVDPGVGSERRALAIKTNQCVLIGPDNGVLIPTAKYFGIVDIREIKNKFLDEISHTFHGRDIFAPAAANLSMGMKFKELGPIVSDFKELDFGNVEWVNEELRAKILHVDRFGNLITNIPRRLYPKIASKETIVISTTERASKIKPAHSYFEGKPKELLILPGSGEFIEISCNKGSAAELLSTKPGDTFILRFRSSF